VSEEERVVIHSDGGCQGNPGPGGWAAVLRKSGRMREISGGAPATTNNRMELQAAIEALKALAGPTTVDFYTDSTYVRQGITEWLPGWKARGWRTATRKPVKNVDLWTELDTLASKHAVSWHWVKGHAGHKDNERCDRLAQMEIDRIVKQYGWAELRRLLAEVDRSVSPTLF